MAVNFSAIAGASTDYASSSVDDYSNEDDDDIEDVSDVAAAPPPAKQSIPAPTKKKKLPQKFPPLKSPAPAKQAKGSTKRLRVVKPAIMDPHTLERIGLGRMLWIQRSKAILFTLITTTMIGLYWFLLDRLTVNLSYDWVVAVYIFVVTAMVVLYFVVPRAVSRFEQHVIRGQSESKILKFFASRLIKDGSNIETGFQVLEVPAASGPVVLTRVIQPKTVVAGRVTAAPILKPASKSLPSPTASPSSSSIAVLLSEGSDDQVDKTDDDEQLSGTDSPRETSVLSAPPSLLLPVQVTRSVAAGGKPHNNPRNKVRGSRYTRSSRG